MLLTQLLLLMLLFYVVGGERLLQTFDFLKTLHRASRPGVVFLSFTSCS